MNCFRRRRTHLAALELVVVCGACLGLTQGMILAGEKEGKQITLTDKDNDTKQKLSQGDLLVIHLETQPGTGFSWSIAERDKDHLTLLSSVLLENPNMLPGGKAIQLFIFRAATVGTSDLKLYYRRPFAKDKEPAKKFKVLVTITEGRMILMGDKEGKQVTLTDKDTGAKQKLSRGDLLVVYLDAQPGTGFSWAMVQCHTVQLTLLSSVLLDNPNMLPGGKAVQLFTFRASAVGTSALELHYRQPFAKDKEPAKKFKVLVTIGE